jgi:hypothetical protein
MDRQFRVDEYNKDLRISGPLLGVDVLFTKYSLMENDTCRVTPDCAVTGWREAFRIVVFDCNAVVRPVCGGRKKCYFVTQLPSGAVQ